MSRTLPLWGKGNCPRSGAHSRWQIFPGIIHPGDISFPHLGQFIKATPLRKQKNPCLNKETKAISSAVPLFLPDKHVRPLKFCPVTGASGEAYSSSALCSKVMFPGSSRPPCTQTAALCTGAGDGTRPLLSVFRNKRYSRTLCSASWSILHVCGASVKWVI